MLVRIVAEVTLPDGRVLRPGRIVDTKDYPGLLAAITAKAAVIASEMQETPLRTK